ncbi:hypothetical protein Tco_1183445 [Tanacetum coccineum]
MDYQCTHPHEEIDKIIQRTQERGIEICRQNEELNRVHEETMQMLRELIKVQDEKRIAKEKEAAELEAKRKSQEFLNTKKNLYLKLLTFKRNHELDRRDVKYFSNPLYDLDDEIITNEKILPNQKDLDVVIPIPPGIDERCFNTIDLSLHLLIPLRIVTSLRGDRLISCYPMTRWPTGIEIDLLNLEGDIHFLEELLSNDSPPLPENESFSLDHFDDPSLSLVGDISEHDVLMPNLLPTQPTLCPVFDLLLPFSSENEDKVFKPGGDIPHLGMSRTLHFILLDQAQVWGIESGLQDSDSLRS